MRYGHLVILDWLGLHSLHCTSFSTKTKVFHELGVQMPQISTILTKAYSKKEFLLYFTFFFFKFQNTSAPRPIIDIITNKYRRTSCVKTSCDTKGWDHCCMLSKLKNDNRKDLFMSKSNDFNREGLKEPRK
jgi:hypothetical protein